MICVHNVTCRINTIFDIGFIGYYCQMALEYFARTEEKQRKLCHVVYFPVLGFRNWSNKDTITRVIHAPYDLLTPFDL